MERPQKIMRILRESNDYSQEYVADVLNINQKTYSSLELGKSKLTVDRIHQLAELYHVTPDYFLGDELPVINFNNTGSKSNSNSGYIHTYINDKNTDSFYERIISEKDNLIKEKDSQISTLKEMIEVLKSKIEILNTK
ncbi:helix-turn-helix transcriptional regulator [Algoriphagus sp. H41]|uniref:Helix-turn-helix transcriptional regulator n=1 Tax=Algoriphagus oliviformis TaxID=2811231 RepID=A0ABS3BXE1_9BACT|nr:helix-turn-helix transcriptional regulator [Algoriphagus oliviformis]MBN7809532.1 helix-turn-helix transcriptional regulator [Algoriphagus oliviformis]